MNRIIISLIIVLGAPARAQDLSFYYTVQFYSGKTAPQKSLISNFRHEVFTHGQNGLLVHNTGKFSSFERALNEMRAIRSETSFKDAFVVAYLNEKIVPFHEARKIELSQTSPIDEKIELKIENQKPDDYERATKLSEDAASPKDTIAPDYYPDETKLAPKISTLLSSDTPNASVDPMELEVSLVMQTGHNDRILDIDIDPNNSLIASAGKDRKIIIWDIKSGKQLMVFHGHRAAVNSVDFHPYKPLVLSASDDGTVREWDLMSSAEIRRFEDYGHAVKEAKYSLNADHMITAGNFIRVYNADGSYRRLDFAAKNFFDVLEFRKDKDHFVFGGKEENWLYECRLSDLQIVSKQYSKLRSLAFRDRDSLLYYTSPFGKFTQWDETLQKKEGIAANKSLNAYNAVCLNDAYIFLAEKSGLIRVIDRESKAQIRTLNAHLGEVTDLCLTTNGKYLVSAGIDQYIILWDAASGRMMTTYKGGIEKINQMKFTPDGTKMAVVFDNGLMKYWDLSTNQIITNSYKASSLLSERGWKHMLSSLHFENDSSIAIEAYRVKTSVYDERYYSKVVPERLEWNIASNVFSVLEPSKTQTKKQNSYFKRDKNELLENKYFFLEDSSNFGKCDVHDYEVYIKNNNDIVLITNGDTSIIPSGHTDYVSSVSFNPKYPVFATASWDGIINIWHAKNKNLVVSLGSFGMDDFIYVDRDHYYYSSKGALNRVAFRMGVKAFEFDQFDLVYNRPDLVFAHLPYAEKAVLNDYKRAYEKRLSKMGVSIDELMSAKDIPTLELELPVDLSSKNGDFSFRLSAQSNGSALDRLQIFVNGVPEFGKYGLEINNVRLDTALNIKLSEGNNKFQVFVIAKNGRASYKEYFEVINKQKAVDPELYLVTLGASKFKQSDFDLTYAQKDAKDIQARFNSKKLFTKVHQLTLVNEDITLEGIHKVDDFLANARPDDVVLLFAAGHGVLDENLDYYYASYDMDFNDPNKRGIPYQFFEDALGRSNSRKKVMFLDACHSGEVDKEEMMAAAVEENVSEDDIAFRAVGLTAKRIDESSISAFELSKELFADTRISNGSTVVSSAGAGEFAMEGEQWSNGVFTFSLLNGVESMEADLNGDKKIMLSELQSYLFTKVAELTNGKQRPTSRVENLTNDFRIW